MLIFNKIELKTTTSTNDELVHLIKNIPHSEGLIVQSMYQSKGRGQMGTSWYSSPFKNLLFSIYLKPKKVSIENIAYINMTLCLSAWGAIHSFYPDTLIKWPNDIYCSGKKVAGILVESSIQNIEIQHIIAGFGINVNEENFPKHPQACSLLELTGKEIPLSQVLEAFCNELQWRYQYLQSGHFELILNEYNQHLLGKNQVLKFRDAEGNQFKANVLGVNKHGLLELMTEGQKMTYAYKEVSWIF